jgi:hypothetical protein
MALYKGHSSFHHFSIILVLSGSCAKAEVTFISTFEYVG